MLAYIDYVLLRHACSDLESVFKFLAHRGATPQQLIAWTQRYENS